MNELQTAIDYRFNNISLLENALTHSSYANERPGIRNNERLEFLGDSVLGFISAEYFYLHVNRPEGELTKFRAGEVCEKALAGFAGSIGLGNYLKLGKGELNTGGRERPSILADAFEALIAAIYLDGGMEPAKKFVLRFIGNTDTVSEAFTDYKTVLQEVIQQNPEEHLEYILVSEYGPDHDKTFEVEVHLNSNVIGCASGHSKKKAEQAAAKEALKLMGIEV